MNTLHASLSVYLYIFVFIYIPRFAILRNLRTENQFGLICCVNRDQPKKLLLSHERKSEPNKYGQAIYSTNTKPPGKERKNR